MQPLNLPTQGPPYFPLTPKVWLRPVTSTLLVLIADPFGTLDPFGSGSFNSAEGFADFSQMSQVKPVPRSPLPLPVSCASWCHVYFAVCDVTYVFPQPLSSSEMGPHRGGSEQTGSRKHPGLGSGAFPSLLGKLAEPQVPPSGLDALAAPASTGD